MADQNYIEALRGRALENEQADFARRYEGAQWGAVEQDAFDRMWDQMSLPQALQYRGMADVNPTGNRFNEVDLAADDPLVAQFLEQFGERQWTDAQGNPIERPDSGNAAATGYVMGYGDPTYGGYEGRNILQDDSRIIRLPDGRYIREAGNLNSGEIAGAQREDETQIRRMRQRGAMMAAAVLGGGMAANAGFFGDLGLSSSGLEAAIPGNLSWTTPASTIPEFAAIPEIVGPGAAAAAPAAGADWAANGGFGAGGLSPEEMGVANYLDGPGLPREWWRDVADFGRDLLGGGDGGGGGILGIMGGGSQAPRIGDRQPDTDPYGLLASGFGPWTGILPGDEKTRKVAEAMMKRTKTNPWG